jgi:peroxiredoxin
MKAFAAFLAMLLIMTAQSAHCAQTPVSLPLGSKAPSVILPEVNGKLFDLSDYKGKTVVLNFWAFWCDTWKAELPHLRELDSRKGDLDFTLVTISVDSTRIAEFSQITNEKLPFPVLLDSGGKVSDAYKVHTVPTVVVIDPDGHVRYTATGYPGNQPVLTVLRRIYNEQHSKKATGILIRH